MFPTMKTCEPGEVLWRYQHRANLKDFETTAVPRLGSRQEESLVVYLENIAHLSSE